MKQVKIDDFTYMILEVLEELLKKDKTIIMHDLVKSFVVFDLEKEQSNQVIKKMGGK